MHIQALPYVFLLSFFWGTNLVASRFGIGEFEPFQFITFRLLIALAFFIPFVVVSQGRISTDRLLWRNAAISGIFGVAIPIPTFIWSLQFQSSGVASLYVTMLPVMIVIAAHFFLPDEKMNWLKGLGVSVALGGALFLAISGESGLAEIERANPLGAILILFGLLSETFNTTFVRRNMVGTDPNQVTVIRLLTAAVVVGIVTLLFGEVRVSNITAAGYFSLAYASIIGALGGQFLAFYIQRRFGATAFSLQSFLVPVVAIISGAIVLGELITFTMLIGMAMIASGLYLINQATKLTPQLSKPKT